jgi:hypothetical protein
MSSFIMRNVFLSFALSSLLLAACADDGPSDVVGPFTGTTTRYVVDSIVLPTETDDVQALGDDLDGDGDTDNKIGDLTVTLDLGENVTTHGADMIASGAIASTVEITADDLSDDGSVGVTYHGHDGDAAVAAGGRLVDGRFTSNRTRDTSHPGAATVVLPVFVDADPTTLALTNVEIDLEPDGAGGFDALLRGTTDPAAALAAAYAGSQQMLAANPPDHVGFMQAFDYPTPDWTITQTEFAMNSVIASLFHPDITIDGVPLLSFGARFHLSPCAEGHCTSAPPADLCHDRVLDGDEADIDCGGSCDACAGDQTCAVPADCQSEQCEGAVCAAPSCDDGVTDGFETSPDFGGPC